MGLGATREPVPALRLRPGVPAGSAHPLPADRARRAHAKPGRGLTAGQARVDGGQNTRAEVEGQRFGHTGWPPSPAAALNQIGPALETQTDSTSANTALDVTDEQWRRLEPLLPPERPRTGRPNHDHRRVVSGMLWIHRTGAPWRDLPERYGPVGTVSSRFYRWCRAGVWDRILSALQAEADARGEIDWDLHFVDATIIRAPQHAAGARRTGAVGG